MRKLTIVLCLVVFLAAHLLCEAGPNPEPRRRGGGGGSRSRGSSSGWFGGSRKQKGSYGQGKKKGIGSKLKKAAVIGATAYGAYQIGKLAGKFSHHGFGPGYGGWGFQDWNRWRRQDGFLCRNDQDCNWIDRNLFCEDYELDFQPSALWFGGDVARIVGECDCAGAMVWDDYEMQCQTAFFSLVGVIVGVIVAILLLCCGCVCCFFIYRRFA